MKRVLTQLQARGVRLESLHALEVFGGTGEFTTKDYAQHVAPLEIWEIDQQCETSLRRNFPTAKIRITDSYEEVRRSPNKYELIVVDNPFSLCFDRCEHFELFPAIFRVAADTSILVLLVTPSANWIARKKYPYLFSEKQLEARRDFYQTENPEEVSLERMGSVYGQLAMNAGFKPVWHFHVKRSIVFGNFHLVMRIQNRDRPT